MRPSSTNRLEVDLDEILARTEPLWQELRGQRLLITGATGFFGCWLLESFAWANRRLHLNAHAVGLSRHPGTLLQKAPHLAADSAITLHAANIRCDDFPDGRFSHIVHAATDASAALNRENPSAMFDTIVAGTRRTLELAATNPGCKFLFLSSGAVYGSQPPQIALLPECFAGGPDPLDPANAYAEGKRAAELLCAVAPSATHIKIARCFAFVGPYMRLDAHFAIGNFLSDRLHQRPIQVKGDGSAVRSYLYASDLMVWLWTILFNGQRLRPYNVGSEEASNISTLAHEVNAVLPPAAPINIASAHQPNTPIHRYVPSTARAREELHLVAAVPLREAIRRTYAWFSAATTLAPKVPGVQPNARGTHA